MEYLKKDIVGCCSSAIFEINKIISNLNVSSFTENIPNRIFDSTLCFRKSWWINHNFSNTNKHESLGLLNDKEIVNHFEEIPYNSVIISLIHKNNTNDRIKIKGETNGSHFNFSDELFTLITSLDNENSNINLNKNLNLNKSDKNNKDEKETNENDEKETNENDEK